MMRAHCFHFAVLGQLFSWALVNAEKPPAITALELGDGVQEVQVAQTFFGTPGTCEEGSKNQASTLFATYLDPESLKLTCGIFERNVGACFKKNILIGCDPDTNTAKIDLYILDESISRFFMTDNPKLGSCKAGSRDYIKRAIKVTEVFPCIPAPGTQDVTGPGTCSDAHDDCGDGTFCANSPEAGYFCKEFVPLGGQCSGEGLEQCNTSEAYCLNADCLVPGVQRICTAYGGICSTDSDCTNDEYCSKTENKCRAKLNKGNCCDRSQNQCKGGFCNYHSMEFDENNKRVEIFTCKPYVPVGSGCGAFRMRGSEDRCDPNEAYCYKPMDCVIADYGGTCVAFRGTPCASTAECGLNEYCDGSFCKPQVLEGECCNMQDDLCAEGLSCQSNSGTAPTCQP